MAVKRKALIIYLLALIGSLTGVYYLTRIIDAGTEALNAGQKQLMDGEARLMKGRERLAGGKRDLSVVKQAYDQTKKESYVVAAVLPVAGAVAMLAGSGLTQKKIADGEQQVARGRKKVQAGEQMLAEGMIKLRRGKALLILAKMIRFFLGVSVFIFSILLIMTFFCREQIWIEKLKKIRY